MINFEGKLKRGKHRIKKDMILKGNFKYELNNWNRNIKNYYYFSY